MCSPRLLAWSNCLITTLPPLCNTDLYAEPRPPLPIIMFEMKLLIVAWMWRFVLLSETSSSSREGQVHRLDRGILHDKNDMHIQLKNNKLDKHHEVVFPCNFFTYQGMFIAQMCHWNTWSEACKVPKFLLGCLCEHIIYDMHTKEVVSISCDPDRDIKMQDNSALSLVVISMLLYIVVMLCIVASFRYKKCSSGLSNVRWLWMLLCV